MTDDTNRHRPPAIESLRAPREYVHSRKSKQSRTIARRLLKGVIKTRLAKQPAVTIMANERNERLHIAVIQEQQIRRGSRMGKIGLIESANPEWRALSPRML